MHQRSLVLCSDADQLEFHRCTGQRPEVVEATFTIPPIDSGGARFSAWPGRAIRFGLS